MVAVEAQCVRTSLATMSLSASVCMCTWSFYSENFRKIEPSTYAHLISHQPLCVMLEQHTATVAVAHMHIKLSTATATVGTTTDSGDATTFQPHYSFSFHMFCMVEPDLARLGAGAVEESVASARNTIESTPSLWIKKQTSNTRSRIINSWNIIIIFIFYRTTVATAAAAAVSLLLSLMSLFAGPSSNLSESSGRF